MLTDVFINSYNILLFGICAVCLLYKTKGNKNSENERNLHLQIFHDTREEADFERHLSLREYFVESWKIYTPLHPPAKNSMWEHSLAVDVERCKVNYWIE